MIEIELQYSPTQAHSELSGNLELTFTDPELGTVDVGLVARVQQHVFVVPSEAVLVAGAAPTILSIYAPQGITSALEQCNSRESPLIEISGLTKTPGSSWWGLAIAGKDAGIAGKRAIQIKLSYNTTVNYSVSVIR